MTSRGWIFTIHCVNHETGDLANNPLFIELPNDVRYVVWQKEQGGNTRRLHYQGYIQFLSPVRMSQVKTVLDCNWAHVEKQRGTDAQASDYGMKEDTRVEGPWSFGELAKQGQRLDLQKVIDMCKSQQPLSSIASESPLEWIKFNRGIQSLSSFYRKSTIRLGLEVIVLIGSTGTGKSRWCWRNYPQLYSVNFRDKQPTWWDGYDGEKAVLFDDFAGEISITELLKYLDIYPLKGPVKGSFVPLNYTVVMMTSNVPWEEWYRWITQPQKDALRRRLTTIYTVNSGADLPPDRIDRHLE